jgi:hypothetical protein
MRMLCLGLAAVVTTSACGSAKTPTTPASTTLASGNAGASGETLKIGAPTLTSPIGGVQLQTSTIVLTFQSVAGTYATFTPSYELELRNPSNTVVLNPTLTSTSYTVPVELEFDTNYTWRVRAVYEGAVGPWSSTATFKTQVSAFISGNTIYDPLSIGRTVGTRQGATTFIAGEGLRLDNQASTLRYNLPTTLQAGQFSMLIKGADEGSAGDKSKVFSMMEGDGDITTNDYRATVELRGSQYTTPGAISGRIITGEADDEEFIHDFPRQVNNFSSARWYFWSLSWQTGSARLVVKADNEAGPTLYDVSIGTGSHPYRPSTHTIFLGAPIGRAGIQDATIGGGPVYRNVFVGPTTRPSFPGLSGPGGR